MSFLTSLLRLALGCFPRYSGRHPLAYHGRMSEGRSSNIACPTKWAIRGCRIIANTRISLIRRFCKRSRRASSSSPPLMFVARRHLMATWGDGIRLHLRKRYVYHTLSPVVITVPSNTSLNPPCRVTPFSILVKLPVKSAGGGRSSN